MSWIFGGFSKNGKLDKIKIPFTPDIKYEKKDRVIYGTGESLIFFTSANNSFHLIAGSGLSEDLELLETSDWKHIVNSGRNISNLNGHFMVISETSDGFQIINDQLGLRELFLYDNGNEVFFSSRLNWIINLIEFPTINHNFLNSLWNFENPLIYETLVDDVMLLGPGGKAKISKNGIEISNNAWQPEKKKSSIANVIESVSKIIDSIISKKGKVNLGLSGGMDSRSLVSLLLTYDKKFWETYTFGQKNNFDVKIANSIAKSFNFNHIHHDIKLFGADDTFGTWQDFVLETNCSSPANLYHELNYYKVLPKDEFFIDGGKGEYLRRGLSNRLAVLGKQALLDKNITNIKKYLQLPKPKIFNKDVVKKWKNIQNIQINNLITSMPDVNEIGIHNWVDIYNIRYRTANNNYPLQIRLDKIIPNLMPFIQPKVLNEVLNLPSAFRTKELVNRKMLNGFPRLKLFPLARYNTIIPFQYNKYTSVIWGKIMRNFLKESSKNTEIFLELNKDYLLSRFSDSNFINSALYNKKLIKDTVQGYYKGKNKNVDFLLWWMTFDQWHQLFH